MADGEFCNASQRVDGKLHSWEFDGDDPRIKCCWCGEIRDALTGKPIKMSPTSVDPDPWELLRTVIEFVDISASKNGSVPDVAKRLLYQRNCLKQHDAERKSDGT